MEPYIDHDLTDSIVTSDTIYTVKTAHQIRIGKVTG